MLWLYSQNFDELYIHLVPNAFQFLFDFVSWSWYKSMLRYLEFFLKYLSTTEF